MTRWFRHYVGMTRDDKLMGVAARTRQPLDRVLFVWCCILEDASDRNEGGAFSICADQVAYNIRCEVDDVIAIVSGLEGSGRTHDGHVARWSERQFESDSSTSRVVKHRKKRKGAVADAEAEAAPVPSAQPEPEVPALGDGNGDETFHTTNETLQTVSETPPEAESDTETDNYSEPRRSRGRAELNTLERELRQAANLESSPSPGLFDLSPILGFLDAGYDLQSEILPVLRAKSHHKVKSWRYFDEAIKQSRANRLSAAVPVVASDSLSHERCAPRSARANPRLKASSRVAEYFDAVRH